MKALKPLSLHLDRLTIPETPRYTFDVARDIEQAAADVKAYLSGRRGVEVDPLQQVRTKEIVSRTLTQSPASWSDFVGYFGQWRQGKGLLATALSWFMVDFAFYGLGLNLPTVLSVIGFDNTGPTMYQVLHNTAVGNVVLICAGQIPGYWLAMLTVDYLGRKPIQIIGFLALTTIFAAIGFAYSNLNRQATLALYILAQFFFNFGPNSTTFIVPGECFPTRYRASAHGISAAAGKLGATIAQLMVPPLLNKGAPAGCLGQECNTWVGHLMEIFALFMLLGAAISFLIPETRGQTLEVLAGEAPLGTEDPSAAWKSLKRFLGKLGLYDRKALRVTTPIAVSRVYDLDRHVRTGSDHREDSRWIYPSSAFMPGFGRIAQPAVSQGLGGDGRAMLKRVELNDVGMLLNTLK